MEAYETNYGIYNHDEVNVNKPLALVAMHPKEDAINDNSMRTLISRYRIHEINKHYGLTLLEFIALPREYVQYIFADIVKEAAKENVKTAGLLAEVGKKLG